MTRRIQSAMRPLYPSLLNQRGVTLVELMVAMTVGLFLTAGIISLFLGTKQTYRSNEALAVVQEDGRYQLEHLAGELRQSGSLGCQRALMLQDEVPAAGTTDRLMHDSLSIKNALALTEQTDDSDPDTNDERLYWWMFNFSEQAPIEGFDGQGTGFASSQPLEYFGSISALLTALGIGDASPDHDVIVSRRVSGEAIPIIQHDDLDGDGDASNDPLVVPSGGGIDVGDLAIASTCDHATLFQVTDITEDTPCTGLSTIEHEVVTKCDSDSDSEAEFDCPLPLNQQASLGMRYANDVDNPSCPTEDENDAIGALHPAQVSIYFIRDNDDGIPTLWVKRNLKVSQQLITGVYGLQAQFGSNSLAASCDTDENAPNLDAYESADQVENWNEVNAVKLSLLLGSTDEGLANVVEKPLSLAFPGAGDSDIFDASALDAADQRRLYQVFTSTIFLRNKLPCLGIDQWTKPLVGGES